MNKDEAIQYCYDNAERFMELHGHDPEAAQDFVKIVDGLKTDIISPEELHEYGFDFTEMKFDFVNVVESVSPVVVPKHSFIKRTWFKMKKVFK